MCFILKFSYNGISQFKNEYLFDTTINEKAIVFNEFHDIIKKNRIKKIKVIEKNTEKIGFNKKTNFSYNKEGYLVLEKFKIIRGKYKNEDKNGEKKYLYENNNLISISKDIKYIYVYSKDIFNDSSLLVKEIEVIKNDTMIIKEYEYDKNNKIIKSYDYYNKQFFNFKYSNDTIFFKHSYDTISWLIDTKIVDEYGRIIKKYSGDYLFKYYYAYNSELLIVYEDEKIVRLQKIFLDNEKRLISGSVIDNELDGQKIFFYKYNKKGLPLKSYGYKFEFDREINPITKYKYKYFW